jgi:hypothetical protein
LRVLETSAEAKKTVLGISTLLLLLDCGARATAGDLSGLYWRKDSSTFGRGQIPAPYLGAAAGGYRHHLHLTSVIH